MEETLLELDSLDELRKFVRHKLGQQENLLADQFPMTETKLKQGGRECGLQFVLHGPRSVRLIAIYVAAKNELYFYGSRGERCEKMHLSAFPKPVAEPSTYV